MNKYSGKIYENIFDEKDTKTILEMYKDGISVCEIIKRMKSDEHHIRIVLKTFGADRHYNTFENEIYDRIVKKYQEGMTYNEIAYDLLLSEATVGRVLDRLGIQKRSCSDNNRRFNRNSHYFDKIDTQNKAYILGLLFADGNNNPEHNAITICLQEQDVAILEKIKDEIAYEGPLRLIPLNSRNSMHNNQYVLCINDPYMSKHLEKLGVVKAKSLILTFPHYLRMKFIRHFIRGYFDGDGCISFCKTTQKPSVSICGTKEFCSAISEIIHPMNGTCSIYQPKQCKGRNTFVLCINGYNSVNNFMEWIYEDAEIKMERKYQKYLKIKERFKTKINSLIA